MSPMNIVRYKPQRVAQKRKGQKFEQ